MIPRPVLYVLAAVIIPVSVACELLRRWWQGIGNAELGRLP